MSHSNKSKKPSKIEKKNRSFGRNPCSCRRALNQRAIRKLVSTICAGIFTLLLSRGFFLRHSWKYFIYISFFDQKMQFTYPKASIKNVHATGEAFSPQKRTSSTTKNNIKKNVHATGEAFSPQKRASSTTKNNTFFYVRGSFLPSWIRIRIQFPHWIQIQSDSGSNPYPQHCLRNFVQFRPVRAGRRWVPPPPGRTPSMTSGSPSPVLNPSTAILEKIDKVRNKTRRYLTQQSCRASF